MCLFYVYFICFMCYMYFMCLFYFMVYLNHLLLNHSTVHLKIIKKCMFTILELKF